MTDGTNIIAGHVFRTAVLWVCTVSAEQCHLEVPPTVHDNCFHFLSNS